jgi:hypothetical protein
MLFSLPHWLAADATGTSGPLAINALLSDSVIVRRWHFLQTIGILSSQAEVLCSPSNSQHIISEHPTHALILPYTSL